MNNEKTSFQINKKIVLISSIVVLIVVGFSYLYFGTLKIIPTSSETLPSGPTPSSVGGCTCEWNNNYECGGILECKSPSGETSWEKICECNPSGCGPVKGATCGGFSEGTLACTPDIC